MNEQYASGVQRLLWELEKEPMPDTEAIRRAIVPPGSQRLPPGEGSGMAVTEVTDITQAIAAALGG